jgi:hypothetical protein
MLLMRDVLPRFTENPRAAVLPAHPLPFMMFEF